LPDVILHLQEELLKDYTLPPCPAEAPQQLLAHYKHDLSRSETLSLKHYLAWTKSNGTMKAYTSHAQVPSEPIEEGMLSLYKVKQLAMTLTGMKPSFMEMCPRSCMAITGKFAGQSTC
ncbi:hypothetical protein EI94DRAFT_1464461, partial [Lactarius quietus]